MAHTDQTLPSVSARRRTRRIELGIDPARRAWHRKSALLRHAADHADGMTILAAHGVESQADIPFSGLFDLLRLALTSIERIPAPQAAALSGALALGPAVQSDRFIIRAATLSLSAAQPELAPLLLLVDDAPWLDGSSADALAFAIRLLVADPIRQEDGRKRMKYIGKLSE